MRLPEAMDQEDLEMNCREDTPLLGRYEPRWLRILNTRLWTVRYRLGTLNMGLSTKRGLFGALNARLWTVRDRLGTLNIILSTKRGPMGPQCLLVGCQGLLGDSQRQLVDESDHCILDHNDRYLVV